MSCAYDTYYDIMIYFTLLYNILMKLELSDQATRQIFYILQNIFCSKLKSTGCLSSCQRHALDFFKRRLKVNKNILTTAVLKKHSIIFIFKACYLLEDER